MKISNLLIMIIIAALVLTSCQNQNPTTSVTPYVGGSKGVTMNFQDQRPPDKVYGATYEGEELITGSSFSIGIKLENNGEEGLFDEIDNDNDNIFDDFGRLTLSGINSAHYGLDQDDLIINFDDYNDGKILLRPNKKYVEEGPSSQGGIANVQFPIMNYGNDVEGFNEVTFMVDLCYNYKTKSITNICLVEDSDNAKVCKPSETKKTSNSGAPIHVTQVTQIPIGDKKIQTIIEIEKVNPSGEVYAPIDIGDVPDKVCDSSSTNSNKNRVYVKVTLPDGNEGITCPDFRDNDNEGLIELNEGAPTPIFCDIIGDENSNDYQTQLRVDLEYSYGEYMTKTITLAER